MPEIETTASERVPPNIISATFEDAEHAGQAVDALRNLGVNDDAISVVTRAYGDGPHSAAAEPPDALEHAVHPGTAALDGAGVGAAVGAVFGLVSAAIPGAGPFITAGALAQILGAAAGAATSGAIVGGTSGALAGVIASLGVPDEESRHLAAEVERGGMYLGVDVARTAVDRDTVRSVLGQYHGRHPV